MFIVIICNIGMRVYNCLEYSDDNHCVVEFEIELDDPEINTNYDKTDNINPNVNPNIYDKNHALFTINKAKIIKITNMKTDEEFQSFYSKLDDITFEVGQILNHSNIEFSLDKSTVNIKRKSNEFKNGDFKFWYDNGAIYEKGQYINGKYNGSYERFYDNGNKYIKVNFINGTFDESYDEWHKNGKIKKECYYHKGKQVGFIRYYYESGQMKIESQCSGEIRDGLYQEWYENEQRKEWSFYLNNIPQQEMLKWDEDGTLHRIEIDDNDENIRLYRMDDDTNTNRNRNRNNNRNRDRNRDRDRN